MKTRLLLAISFVAFGTAALAQDHGAIIYKGQTIPLTGYRTRVSADKRWVIAEGKKDGKLYSFTVTLKPDVTASSTITTDATHSATLTISNADYSNAQNYCFDGGSPMTVTLQNKQYLVTGKDMAPGNCFGKSGAGDKISFTIKP